MAYNEILAQRVLELIAAQEEHIEEKKMFGGLCFMVNGKMCIGVQQDKVMIRHNPDLYEELLSKEGCMPMMFTGKEMKGYVYVDQEQLRTTTALKYWVDIAIAYNHIAKASKKKKK